MLSSKKRRLANFLIKKIVSDAYSTCSAASSGDQGRGHVARRGSKSSSSFGAGCSVVFDYLVSMCCYSSRTSPDNQSRRTSPLVRKLKKLLRSLPMCDLERLSSVINGHGSQVGECIFASVRDQQQSAVADSVDDISVHVLLCFLLRWPQFCSDDFMLFVSAHHLLRPLPWCVHHSSGTGQSSVCVNPYHWSLLVSNEWDLNSNVADRQKQHKNVPSQSHAWPLTGDDPARLTLSDHQSNHQYYPIPSSTPPPSYSEAYEQADQCPSGASCAHQRNEPSAHHHHQLANDHSANNGKWCSLAYWEFQNRVGRFYHVKDTSVNIHMQSMENDGLSLQSLFRTRKHVPDMVSRTRNKIGLGVSLFRDHNKCVWLYNRSSSSVFVNSHTLSPPETLCVNTIRSSAMTVVKVQPGCLVKVYDYQVAQAIKSVWNSSKHHHCAIAPSQPVQSTATTNSLLPSLSPPLTQQLHQTNTAPSNEANLFDFDSFRFSFVKGFGANYKFQNIMQCPCWMEVILDQTNQS